MSKIVRKKLSEKIRENYICLEDFADELQFEPQKVQRILKGYQKGDIGFWEKVQDIFEIEDKDMKSYMDMDTEG